MTTKIDVDFNDVETGGRMVALLDHAHGPVAAGATVILGDADKNVVQGRVLSIIDHLVTVDVDWSRWNRVNTLLDALSDVTRQVEQDAAALSQLLRLGRPPTGYDPSNPPEPHVKIPA